MANNAAKFSMRQVVLQWSLGMFVSTPIIALLQGSIQLSEYRTNHGDAPRPVMPARGVAVAVERGYLPKFLSNEEPLRLLVVGDSLAAGVGMSKSGTPVLPESIARSLSKALGGRAVYWTCVGTPGVSASQIVQDIHQIEPQEPGRLDRLFREWRAKRKKWQERKEVRRRLSQLESTEYDEKASTKKRNYLKDWWEALRNDPERSPKRVQETTSKMVREWWSQVTGHFRATRERVREDLTDIKEIVQHPQEEILERDNDEELIHKGHAFQRDSLDPEIVAQYDIAVVLTGLNDLKDAFLPHMTTGSKSSIADGTKRVMGGMRNHLQGIVDALEDRMNMDADSSEDGDQSVTNDETQDVKNLHRPLVVVPELPIAPLRLFHLVPLCWFLKPLFRAMENNKRFLSSIFPDYVVFIPQPNLKWWEDVESGLGPIRENIQQERLLLRTTDIAQNTLERIQELMRQHYRPNGEGDEKSGVKGDTRDMGDQRRDEEPPDYHSGHHAVEVDNPRRYLTSPNSSGSPYVAADKMHPNDEGYELWGRHIAAAILEHWKG